VGGVGPYVQDACLQKADFFFGGTGYGMSKGHSAAIDKLMLPQGDNDVNSRESGYEQQISGSTLY
jgi:hypothetical protein